MAHEDMRQYDVPQGLRAQLREAQALRVQVFAQASTENRESLTDRAQRVLIGFKAKMAAAVIGGSIALGGYVDVREPDIAKAAVMVSMADADGGILAPGSEAARLEKAGREAEEGKVVGSVANMATWVRENVGKSIEAVDREGGYTGTVLNVNEHAVAQNVGRTVVVHEKRDLDDVPVVGELVRVKYSGGKAAVSVEPQGLGRGVGR